MENRSEREREGRNAEQQQREKEKKKPLEKLAELAAQQQVSAVA